MDHICGGDDRPYTNRRQWFLTSAQYFFRFRFALYAALVVRSPEQALEQSARDIYKLLFNFPVNFMG